MELSSIGDYGRANEERDKNTAWQRRDASNTLWVLPYSCLTVHGLSI
jgi:hypothetical protein